MAGIDDLHRMLGPSTIGVSIPITVVRGTAKLDLTIVPEDRAA